MDSLEPQKYDDNGDIGLGLAIVARIVKTVEGHLRVDSTGAGSRFAYYLPFKRVLRACRTKGRR